MAAAMPTAWPTMTQKVKFDLGNFLQAYINMAAFQDDAGRHPVDKLTTTFRQAMSVLFPAFVGKYPRIGTWDKESAIVAEKTINLMSRGVERLVDLFHAGHARSWLLHAFTFIITMSTWVRSGTAIDAGVPSPFLLRNNVVNLIVNTLKQLGCEAKFDPTDSLPWKCFSDIIQELVQARKGIWHALALPNAQKLTLIARTLGPIVPYLPDRIHDTQER